MYVFLQSQELTNILFSFSLLNATISSLLVVLHYFIHLLVISPSYSLLGLSFGIRALLLVDLLDVFKVLKWFEKVFEKLVFYQLWLILSSKRSLLELFLSDKWFQKVFQLVLQQLVHFSLILEVVFDDFEHFFGASGQLSRIGLFELFISLKSRIGQVYLLRIRCTRFPNQENLGFPNR